MSYDLYFYKKKGDKLSESGVANYLTETLPFNNSEYNRQWDYENPDTGVYFMIDWNEPDNDNESTFEEFLDFDNLNFSLSINFFRPRFFALEVFPIIEKIVRDLDIYILNPQDIDGSKLPQKFPDEYLKNQWIEDNDNFSVGQFDSLKLEYLSLEKSNYFWWYQFHKQELLNNIIEDIYIPRIFIVKKVDDNKLYTACSWTSHIPIILPVVDYLIIQKKYRKVFKMVEESGVVSYQTVIEHLGTYFENFEFEVPNLKLLTQRRADAIGKIFNDLKIIAPFQEYFIGASNDSFVNIKPETK